MTAGNRFHFTQILCHMFRELVRELSLLHGKLTWTKKTCTYVYANRMSILAIVDGRYNIARDKYNKYNQLVQIVDPETDGSRCQLDTMYGYMDRCSGMM